ncbi:hypothetical protein D9758_001126 [Tetrapyrgos nigripes]|uniref:Uncharacterized protein n=1 Tax=Tetrapyrgos nigripes TaxID=182062 RepID=A0A8H5GSK9_9AGAR|nr:hypothetical protein D9758_001126 [Tetrapyrgos nigripes]
MLTRPEFDDACKALIAKFVSTPASLATSSMKGWCWNEHSYVSGLGYMSRNAVYSRRLSSIDEGEIEQSGAPESDEATLSIANERGIFTCRQYVVFSATFQVPCFYFSIYNSGGVPLSLEEILKTTLFQPCVVEAEKTRFAIGGTFPLLSQGDHPTLGTPCWYFHPCETAAAVRELLREKKKSGGLDVVETWFTCAVTGVFETAVSSNVDISEPQTYKAMFSTLLTQPSRLLRLRVRSMSTEAVIVAASRTPTGSINGALKSFKAPELGVAALKHALASKNIDPTSVEEIYFGNVVQAGVGQSPARQVALGAGMSTSSDATTINKVCASGMKSIMLAAQSIQLGQRSVVAAGGMESMSNAPFLLPRTNPAFGKFTTIDSLEYDGLWDTYNNQAMGCCGESAAEKHNIDRQSVDSHAIESYKRAEKAWSSGAFDAEIAPLTVKGKKGDTVVREDEEYKRIIYDKVPSLRSAFKQGGLITAANSSPSMMAKELGLTPLAKVISYADAGVEPIDFPIAPTVAMPKALERAKLTVDDISLFEINEAFSVVVRIAEQVLKIDPAKINVNGGAVALGHAIGSSGARIVVSLIHALKSGQYGCAGVCNGGGAASALVIQKV